MLQKESFVKAFQQKFNFLLNSYEKIRRKILFFAKSSTKVQLFLGNFNEKLRKKKFFLEMPHKKLNFCWILEKICEKKHVEYSGRFQPENRPLAYGHMCHASTDNALFVEQKKIG